MNINITQSYFVSFPIIFQPIILSRSPLVCNPGLILWTSLDNIIDTFQCSKNIQSNWFLNDRVRTMIEKLFKPTKDCTLRFFKRIAIKRNYSTNANCCLNTYLSNLSQRFQGINSSRGSSTNLHVLFKSFLFN